MIDTNVALMDEYQKGLSCDVCGKPATTNWQTCWVRWSYNVEKGEYGPPEVDGEAGESDHFFCNEHEEAWLEGEV